MDLQKPVNEDRLSRQRLAELERFASRVRTLRSDMRHLSGLQADGSLDFTSQVLIFTLMEQVRELLPGELPKGDLAWWPSHHDRIKSPSEGLVLLGQVQAVIEHARDRHRDG